MQEVIALETIADLMRSHPNNWLGENQILRSEAGLKGFAQAKDKGIVLSGSDNQVSGFIPSRDLVKAFEKANSEESLTFNEEYAVEVLWHEVQHLRIVVSDDHPASEALIQLAARHSYPQLLKALGLSVSNQESIIQNGYGYAENVENLRWMLNYAGIDEAKAAQETLRVITEESGDRSLAWHVSQWLARQGESSASSYRKALKQIRLPTEPAHRRIRRDLSYGGNRPGNSAG